jgi:hypothetical protein
VNLRQLKSRGDDLHPQVVFLVDHHAERFVAGNRDGAAVIALGQMLGDQVPLEQQPPILHRRLIEVHPDHAGRQVAVEQHRPGHGKHVLALGRAGPVHEGKGDEIPRHAHAAAQDDIAVRGAVLSDLAA